MIPHYEDTFFILECRAEGLDPSAVRRVLEALGRRYADEEGSVMCALMPGEGYDEDALAKKAKAEAREEFREDAQSALAAYLLWDINARIASKAIAVALGNLCYD